MSRRRRTGFTLLEMTLVLLLIGLLATLVVPRVLGRTAEARRVRAAADLQILAQALEGYRLDAGIYPTTGQGLDALVRQPTLPPQPPRWRPDGYLPSLPRDPWERRDLFHDLPLEIEADAQCQPRLPRSDSYLQGCRGSGGGSYLMTLSIPRNERNGGIHRVAKLRIQRVAGCSDWQIWPKRQD